MSETNELAGLVITGMSSTYMFDGSQAFELILVDLGNGATINFPISEDQAETVIAILQRGGEEGDAVPVDAGQAPAPHLAAVPTADQNVLSPGKVQGWADDPDNVPEYDGGALKEV